MTDLSTPALARLIAPRDPADFYDHYWERQVLHVARDEPGYFASLSADLSISETVWQSCLKWGEVSLAGPASAVDGVTARPPTAESVGRAFAAGMTIVINHLERKNLSVAKLCRALEQEWLLNTNVNLYCTKARTQGLGYHYDDDDVFILQLAGSKLWRIYETDLILPLAGAEYSVPDCDSSPYTEYLLEAGDTLYLPRGFVHEARALAETSIHLTLTVEVVRWVTVLHQLLDEQAKQLLPLRRAVPQDRVLGQSNELAQELLAALTGEPTGQRVRDAFCAVRRDLVATKARLPADGDQAMIFGAPEPLHTESVVVTAPDQIVRIDKSDGAAALNFIGGSLQLSPDLAVASDCLCSGVPVIVRDAPGGLSDAERLKLAELLVSYGVLRVVSGS